VRHVRESHRSHTGRRNRTWCREVRSVGSSTLPDRLLRSHVAHTYRLSCGSHMT